MENTIRKSNKTVSAIVLGLMYAVMILLAFTMVFPYFYMVMTTFKTQAESLEAGLNIFPKVWTVMAAQGVFWFLGIWNDYFPEPE